MRAQSLLVVNQGDSDLSILDPVSQKQVARIAEDVAGVHGHEIAVSTDGRTAYMPIYGNAGVGKPGIDGRALLIIDLPSRKVVGTIDFGHGVRPHMPILDAKRGLLYVTTELDQAITVIDPQSRKIVGTIPTKQEQSHMLVLSHDGRRGYTANVGPGTVSVLDMVARKSVAVIPVVSSSVGAVTAGWRVQRIAISNDDKLVFTADQTQPRMAVIDTATNRVRSWIPLPGIGFGSAATRDGRWLLVTLPAANQVAVVDLKSMRVAHRIDVPSAPQEILLRPDGKVAYVSCGPSEKVAVVGLSDWQVKKLIAVGRFADGLAWAP